MKQPLNFVIQNLLCQPQRLLLLAGICFLSATGHTQGLFKNYSDYFHDDVIGYDIRELPNGNYRLVANGDWNNHTGSAIRHLILDVDHDGNVVDSVRANFVSFTARGFWLPDRNFLQPVQDLSNGSDSTFNFIKTSPSGDTLWGKSISFPAGADLIEWVHADVDKTGNYWIAGVWFKSGALLNTRLILIKMAPNGTIIWNKIYQTTPLGEAISETTVKFRFTQDNGCILQQFINGTQVLRFDSTGTIVWQQAVAENTTFSNMNLSADDRCLILGQTYLYGLDSAGAVSFQFNLGSLGLYYQNPSSAIPTSDGGWAVMGSVYVNSKFTNFILKLSAAGEQQWLKIYDFRINPWAGCETAQHELLWLGGLTLIRMDSTGTIFKNHLAGRIAFDDNLDCALQPAEPGLPGWVLKLENGGSAQYTTSDSAGLYYFAEADTGAQALFPITQNYLWQACASAFTSTIPADSSDYTLPLDAPMQSQFDCPVMSVDLATPRLRRCFNNTYALHCCNFGNQTATDAYVEVYLPPHLLVQGASQPFTQDGLKLTFPLGTVAPFQCINIQLVVKPDCDSTELGQSMCVSAHVFPDTVCGAPPGWSGALIEVSGACTGDSVQFHIQNTGNAPTSQPLDFIVIDDHVMTLQGNYNLAAHASRTETFPADGSTWRLQSEQEPNAPGAAMPSVAVEGCSTGGGPFSTGFVTQWPNENGSPFWERDCHTLINAYDPNAKQAAPAGVDAPHWILPNTPLEYLIEFQNTGNDTAFTVVLRDTLAPTLDPGSVRPGASSHPYTWSLSGAGILTFRFDNILLPDSTTNEPASHGFVRFRVQQQPDLPDDTHLDNRAGIYFDFNAPVLTNTVFHTVGRDFLPMVGLPAPPVTAPGALGVFPNPARESVLVTLKNGNTSGGRLTLSDAYGRVLARENMTGKTVEIRRLGRAAGLYWLRWEAPGGKTYFQKILWE